MKLLLIDVNIMQYKHSTVTKNSQWSFRIIYNTVLGSLQPLHGHWVNLGYDCVIHEGMTLGHLLCTYI